MREHERSSRYSPSRGANRERDENNHPIHDQA